MSIFKFIFCGALLSVVGVGDATALSADKARRPTSLVASHDGEKANVHHFLQKHPIVALQTSQSTKMHRKKASALQTKRVHKVKSHHSEGLRVATNTSDTTATKTGLCRGSKLRWWVKIKKKCMKAYGKKSKWDRERMDGKCADHFKGCNTGMYAVCCSQPQGAKTMDAYCANQNLTFVNKSDLKHGKKEDKACQVAGSMNSMGKIMKGIKGAVGMLQVVDQAQTFSFAPGPAPAPAAALAIGPPSGILVIGGPSPAPAPQEVLAPVKDRCAILMELTRQAAEKVKDIKKWAKNDGIKDDDDKPDIAGSLEDGDPKAMGKAATSESKQIGQETNPDDAEAKDPDMAHAVKGVLRAGKKLDALLKSASFCKSSKDDDEDDDDDEDEDEEEEDEEPSINETAIMSLLDWETDMSNSVDNFEKDVHPHGLKWWRYRYEYTLVESLVLAFSVMLLYFVMWLLAGVSFFASTKFYKTGFTDRLYRYAWAYFVFHGASLMVMVTVAYMLYIPWGENNIFDIGARQVHGIVDGRANVPFLGYSWLYMVLDVQFQLFICFSFYALFLMFVIKNYVTALEDFKLLADGKAGECKSKRNVELYQHYDSILSKRVNSTSEYRQLFHKLKLRLRGVQGLDTAVPGWTEFRLHLYLTDGLGRSLEYLVQVSLTTNIFLAISALIVALLAHHYQVAFMYFLPGFFILAIILFAVGFVVSHHFRNLADKDDHNSESRLLTVHSYCRCIQVCLYCVFFSFARLLLSNDIFSFYPRVYFGACIGLVVILVALYFVGGDAIKETACALILPPHLPVEDFQRKLDHIVHWHHTDRCSECGSAQSTMASASRQWAGNAGEHRDGTGKAQAGSEDTFRPRSFR